MRFFKTAMLLMFLLMVQGVWAQTATVTLVWDANTEADLAGYNAYRAASIGGPYEKINPALISCGAADSACTTFVDTVTLGLNYYYVVTAVNLSGLESGYSNEVLFRKDNTVPPTAPTGLTVTEQGATVELRWNPVEGASGYGVFFRGELDETWTLVEVVGATSWAGKITPPTRKRGSIGVSALNSGGWGLLSVHRFE